MRKNKINISALYTFIAKRAFAATMLFIVNETCHADHNLWLHGALVSEPCIISPGDEAVTLDFGNIVDKYIYHNRRTLGQNFSISLKECDLSVGGIVTITFQGNESLKLPGLIEIDASSMANGIAVGLETSDAKPLPLNQESPKILLQPGSNIITLRAYVEGEPDAIANQHIEYGSFTATVTFTLNYE